MSSVAVVILVLVKIQINDRFRKQLRNIPLPIELIMVYLIYILKFFSKYSLNNILFLIQIISATVLTYFTKLDQTQGLRIIGEIPKG